MKRLGLILLAVFVGLLELVLLVAPYLAPLFGLTLVGSAIGSWIFHSALCATYFAIAWKVYVAVTLLTFGVLTTFAYQECCHVFQPFRQHLLHRGWGGRCEDLLASLGWPYTWYVMDQNFRGWTLSWGFIVLRAIEWWCVGWSQGVSLETVNLRTGETTSGYVKKPEEAIAHIDNAIRQTHDT